MHYVQREPGTDSWQATPTVIHATYVVVCTGLHVIPSVPHISGVEHILNRPPRKSADGRREIKPAVFHSSEYKSRSQLAGRRVMILGTGETGMDIAYEAAKAGAEEAVLCTRGG